MGIFIKCQSLADARSLLHTMFIVITNKTDGISVESGIETLCETQKKKSLEVTSIGFVFQERFEDILAVIESKNEARDHLQEELYTRRRA